MNLFFSSLALRNKGFLAIVSGGRLGISFYASKNLGSSLVGFLVLMKSVLRGGWVGLDWLIELRSDFPNR